MAKRLKLTLVVPNYRWTQGDAHTFWIYVPYAMCLLAAMVEKLCDVEIIDAYGHDMTPDEFSAAIKKSNPDVVGITVLMDQFAITGHLAAKIVKSIDSNIKVMMGGVYVTINPHVAIKDTNLDYLVLGEGEYVLQDMIGYFYGKNPLPTKGVVYRSEGKVVNTGSANLIKDLDALPLPSYHLVEFDKYSTIVPRKGTIGAPPKLPYIRMLTSRGCPYKCNFCQIDRISGRKFRARSPKSVLKEIRWLKEKYGVRSLIFEDDNFFLDKKRVVEILRGMIEEGLDMPWIAADAMIFRIDEELLPLMRESGCEYVAFALETGTKRILTEIIDGKPMDFDQVRATIAAAKKLGIYVAANFIVGFPTETWDEIRATLRFADHVNADYVRIFAAIPLHETRLWDLAVKEDALKEGYDHFRERSSWSAGLISTKDFSPDDLTLLRAYEWDRINFSDPAKRAKTAAVMKISEKELLAVRRGTLKSALQKIRPAQNKPESLDSKKDRALEESAKGLLI